MKNYVQFWICVTNDGGSPPVLQSVSVQSSGQEAADYQAATPNTVVKMYYFLLNKFNMRAYISSFWSSFANVDGTLPDDPSSHTDDDGVAQDWNSESPVFASDTGDKASQKALQVAKKVIKDGSQNADIVGVLNLAQMCLAVAALLDRAGPAGQEGAAEFRALAVRAANGAPDAIIFATYNQLLIDNQRFF